MSCTLKKNICESILGTLLDLAGKSKDSKKACLDMEELGMRKDQHPLVKNDKYTLPPALYSLDPEDKTYLCKFLQGVKMLDGYASNIRWTCRGVRFMDLKLMIVMLYSKNYYPLQPVTFCQKRSLSH